MVFRMLPERDMTDFDKAVAALGEHFKPVDIEELRGIEFYHRSQGNELVQQLGISLQPLGHMASLSGLRQARNQTNY